MDEIADPTASDFIPLQYAPRRKRSWRRYWKWGLLALTVIVLWVAWALTPRWREQMQYLYHQRQCLRHSLAPDVVVYEEAPAAALRLRNADGRYRTLTKPRFDFPDNKPPPGWVSPALFVPSPWERLGDPFPDRDVSACVFLHSRSAADGGRLVVVKLGRSAVGAMGHTVILQGSAYLPATSSVGSKITSPDKVWKLSLPVSPSQRLRVFAGQPDSTNADHFTIDYELDGKRGTIDGWLRPRGWRPPNRNDWPYDSELVQLEHRAGPAEWRSPGWHTASPTRKRPE